MFQAKRGPSKTVRLDGSAGLGSGIGSAINADGGDFSLLSNGSGSLRPLGAAAFAGGSYAAQAAAADVTGQQSHFSWAGLVAASLASGVTDAASLPSQPLQAAGQSSGSFATDLEGGLLSGAIDRETSKWLGDNRTQSWESVGEDAFGNALGNAAVARLAAPPQASASDLENAIETKGGFFKAFPYSANEGPGAYAGNVNGPNDQPADVTDREAVTYPLQEEVSSSMGPNGETLPTPFIDSAGALSTQGDQVLPVSMTNYASMGEMPDVGMGSDASYSGMPRLSRMGGYVDYLVAPGQMLDGVAVPAPSSDATQLPGVLATASTSQSLAYVNGQGSALKVLPQSNGSSIELYANGYNIVDPLGGSTFYSTDMSFLGANQLDPQTWQSVVDRYNQLDAKDSPGAWHSVKSWVDDLVGVTPATVLTPDESAEKDELWAMEGVHSRYLADPASFNLGAVRIGAATESLLGSIIIAATSNSSDRTKLGGLYAAQITSGLTLSMAGTAVARGQLSGLQWMGNQGRLSDPFLQTEAAKLIREDSGVPNKVSGLDKLVPDTDFATNLDQPASSANAADALSRKLSAIQNAQQTAAKIVTLNDGRVLYYSDEVPARTPGPTRGASLVTEYDSMSGNVRQYYESYDQAGNPIRVHPKMINGQVVNSPHYPPTAKELGL